MTSRTHGANPPLSQGKSGFAEKFSLEALLFCFYGDRRDGSRMMLTLRRLPGSGESPGPEALEEHGPGKAERHPCEGGTLERGRRNARAALPFVTWPVQNGFPVGCRIKERELAGGKRSGGGSLGHGMRGLHKRNRKGAKVMVPDRQGRECRMPQGSVGLRVLTE